MIRSLVTPVQRMGLAVAVLVWPSILCAVRLTRIDLVLRTLADALCEEKTGLEPRLCVDWRAESCG